MTFISTLRIFLVDVVSITKANCAQPMNYYDSLVLVLAGLKFVLLLVLLASFAWGKCRQRKARRQVR